MQSAAYNFSPSLPLLKSRRSSNLISGSGFNIVRSSSSSSSCKDLSSSASVSLSSSALPLRSWSLSSSSSFSPKFRPWSGAPLRRNDSDLSRFEAKATAVPESAGESEESRSSFNTLVLGALFGLWYLFNIYFNIYNKQVLKVYPFPVTVTTIQFAVGSVLVLFMWSFNLYKKPTVSGAQLAALLPLAVVHTLGNLFTNMSLGKVAVSFTHTIKAMEPFFSVILSAMFLGERPTLWVVASLLPIVGGVGLASATEASFNWSGFWSAMASNLTNQSRNVLSKKLMIKKEDSLDNITLFSIITIMSFILLAPVTLFMEGVKFTPAYLQSAGFNVRQLATRSLMAALCFHAYQQLFAIDVIRGGRGTMGTYFWIKARTPNALVVCGGSVLSYIVSYMILQRVSPVTHSVGNCVKRVVVIVSSVIFFQTPVSPINSLGTGVALAGVFLYSRVKRIKAKPKSA